MKKLFVIAALVFSMVIPASAIVPTGYYAQVGDQESPWDTVVCISPYGYKMTVRSYYDYMKRYSGVENTTYDGWGCCFASKYVVSCKVEQDGTMRITYSGKYYGEWSDEKDWFGATIYPSGVMCCTLTYVCYEFPYGEYTDKYESYYDYNGAAYSGYDKLNGSYTRTVGSDESVLKLFGYKLNTLMNGFMWDRWDESDTYITTVYKYDYDTGEIDSWQYEADVVSSTEPGVLDFWRYFDDEFYSLSTQ